MQIGRNNNLSFGALHVRYQNSGKIADLSHPVAALANKSNYTRLAHCNNRFNAIIESSPENESLLEKAFKNLGAIVYRTTDQKTTLAAQQKDTKWLINA